VTAVGVGAAAVPDRAARTQSAAPEAAQAPAAFGDRQPRTSRDQSRERLSAQPAAKARRAEPTQQTKPKAVGRKYVTTAIGVRTGPGERFGWLDVLPKHTPVAVTGTRVGPWAEIVRSDRSRWVRAEHLANKRPPSPSTSVSTGISNAPCGSGSAVESGLTSNAIAVHRAVCAHFPQVTSYGGLRSDGYHGEGRALDIMITGSTGDAIAEWVRANGGALGVSEVLWSQRIWTVQRSSEGWRYFSDRGSTTANHYDHVHVTVY